MTEIMIDIETMGTKPNCIILTVGAVKFDISGSESFQELYLHLDINQQIMMDRTVDQETMDWWNKQDEAIRNEAFKENGRTSIEESLAKISEFVGDADGIWAQGPTFDIVILENLYRSLNMDTPWKFYKVRDSRTLFSILGDMRPTERTAAHNALEDSRYQARGVQACIRNLGEKLSLIN